MTTRLIHCECCGKAKYSYEFDYTPGIAPDYYKDCRECRIVPIDEKRIFIRERGVFVVGRIDAISYWQFNRGFGNIAYDSTDKNNGTIYGAIWDDGKVGKALRFDGVDDYVSVPHHKTLNFGSGDFTISAWFFLTELAHSNIVNKVDSGYEYVYDLYVWAGAGLENITFAISSEGWEDAVIRYYEIPEVDRWYHVVAMRDGDLTKLYVDGTLKGSADASAVGDIDNTQPLIIGADPLSADYNTKGMIDEVAIWDRALSDSRVRQLYEAGL